MSLDYLNQAIQNDDDEALIRYVRLHFGDGNEKQGKKEIDKAWIEALKEMMELPKTDRNWIESTIQEQSDATLAHLYFRLHFHFVQKSGDWIHDGNL